ncbi:MAG: MucR family transcriptional regulator [Alphaproteobacteria bacterium]|nr:MucR family transcriptional regulator [Alphaproteobacteria bacterium]
MNTNAPRNAPADNPNIFLQLTAEVVSSHVSNNKVSTEDLPTLIREIYSTLSTVETPSDLRAKPEPAIAIKKSVQPDYIVCLEDGKKLKMLKRHLMSAYGMTPEQYRERWNLPSDYPIVAPNYAKQRSKLAKKIGLGKKRASE